MLLVRKQFCFAYFEEKNGLLRNLKLAKFEANKNKPKPKPTKKKEKKNECSFPEDAL